MKSRVSPVRLSGPQPRQDNLRHMTWKCIVISSLSRNPPYTKPPFASWRMGVLFVFHRRNTPWFCGCKNCGNLTPVRNLESLRGVPQPKPGHPEPKRNSLRTHRTKQSFSLSCMFLLYKIFYFCQEAIPLTPSPVKVEPSYYTELKLFVKPSLPLPFYSIFAYTK